MITIALIVIVLVLIASAFWLGGAGGFSNGYSEGYDRGKVDGLHEGWKHWPERDSRGRYKRKSK